MSSKWIEEVYEEWASEDDSWSEIEEILERIDKLLRLASYCVEPDKQLYDDIRKEINGNW